MKDDAWWGPVEMVMADPSLEEIATPGHGAMAVVHGDGTMTTAVGGLWRDGEALKAALVALAAPPGGDGR